MEESVCSRCGKVRIFKMPNGKKAYAVNDDEVARLIAADGKEITPK